MLLNYGIFRWNIAGLKNFVSFYNKIFFLSKMTRVLTVIWEFALLTCDNSVIARILGLVKLHFSEPYLFILHEIKGSYPLKRGRTVSQSHNWNDAYFLSVFQTKYLTCLASSICRYYSNFCWWKEKGLNLQAIKYWMVYRGLGLLDVVWSCRPKSIERFIEDWAFLRLILYSSPNSFTPLLSASCLSFSVFLCRRSSLLTVERGRGGQGAKSYGRKKALPTITIDVPVVCMAPYVKWFWGG